MRVLFTLFPMTLATLGAFVDERTRLGFTLWRDACRSAGLTAGALATFTMQLLPTALVGALLGGLVVLSAGWLCRSNHRAARATLAAHLGCVVAMAAGMVLCTLFLPPAWMLVIEPLLAIGLSGWLFQVMRPRAARASVGPLTSTLPSA